MSVMIFRCVLVLVSWQCFWRGGSSALRKARNVHVGTATKLSVEAGLERGADGDSRTVPRHVVTLRLVTRQGAK